MLIQSTRGAASFRGRERRRRPQAVAGEDLLGPRPRRRPGAARHAPRQADRHRARAAARHRARARSPCSARPATCATTAATAARSSSGPVSLGGVNVINALDVDDYVRGVIPLEVSATWPAEALKAQAVAARTYALTTNKNGDGFDHYSNTSSQVYGGVAAEQATSDAAARRDQGPARDLPGRAGRDLLLLDLRRAHRGRREERPRHRAAAVAPLRRGQVRQRLARATAGARSG